MTPRWRIDLAYDGSGFAGWARQPGLRTVQGELERWVQTVLRLPEPPELVVAGRTDAGVHARGQVAHVDLGLGAGAPAEAKPDELARRLRRALPDDLVVHRVSVAPEGFDARFAAVWRRYVYRLADAATSGDPLVRGFVLTVHGALDLSRVAEVAPALLGLHDFAAFCKRREGATTVRTLLDLDAWRTASGVVEVTVRADAFCHSMVRSLVGALVAVADGRREPEWLTRLVDARARESSVPVLPAHGLTLEEVGYPADADLAVRVGEARARRVLA